MTGHVPGPGRREAGFVLVGVIIFVLALTIIGISLFSLSSYEAQFLERSLDGEQAFQSAVGGIDRSRFALCETSRLEAVGQNLPENVIAAVAIQVRSGDSISTGPVEWVPDQVVHLRVTARVDGEQRTVTARFTPQEASNYYRQLLTTSGRVAVDPPESADPGLPAQRTIDLGGRIWQGTIQSPADTSWRDLLRSWAPGPPILQGSAEVPDLASYFVAHPVGTALPAGYTREEEPIDLNRYFLTADPAVPTYYRVPAGFNAGACLYDMCNGAIVTVIGRGCVVWELPAGVHFLNPVFIRADVGAPGHHWDDRCLVIVAGPDPAEPAHPAIFFEGGLQSDIPLILVSDGAVGIQHINNPGFTNEAGFSTVAGDLAVFARNVVLRGPRSGTIDHLFMELRHPVNGSLDRTWVRHLAEHGGLPDLTSASGHELALRPGTWRASTP